MRVFRIMASLCMVLTIAIVFAFDAAPLLHAQGAAPATLPWGKEAGGLVIAATVDPPATRPGQRIVLTITVKNVSDHDIAIVVGNASDNQIEMIAPDARHTICPLTLYGDQQAFLNGTVRRKSLHPGESSSSRIPELSRNYDMTLRGKYTITVRRQISPGVFVISQPAVVTIDDKK